MNGGKFWAMRTLAILGITLTLAACGTETAPTGSATPPSAAPTAAPGSPPSHAPGSLAGTPAAGTSRVPAGAASPLISATDLQTLLDQDHPRLRVIDMSSADEYAAGHIPGAIHVDWSELNVTDTSAASITAWQKQVAD